VKKAAKAQQYAVEPLMMMMIVIIIIIIVIIIILICIPDKIAKQTT
jgi:hypothetical protein